eukprot:TRINITY_DN4400_c0_g1_i1.p1 TRINITY_DN4400_c0_g1~~TRINITY_DN4400_c0_g1_i1.p1  ORF type:complete len:289 (+),score=34.00 TRINITY_DN4400_c0_g1_i1:202-1068(+)
MSHFNFSRCPNVDAMSDVCVLHFKHEFGHYSSPKLERNTRDFYKITLINKGEATLYCNDAEFALSPGKIFLSHPNDMTSCNIHTEYLDIYDVILKRSVLHNMHNSNCELFKIFATNFKPTHDSDHIIVLDAGKEITKIVQLMYRESQRDAIFHTLAVNLYLQLLLINLERIYSIAVQINISDEMVGLVNDTIEESFQSSLDFQGLAAKTGVTLEHLGRVYRKASGYSISQALRQRRLKNAAELLKNSRVVISEVAMCSGFQDLSYFFRSFKAEFSISPAEYRKRYGLK